MPRPGGSGRARPIQARRREVERRHEATVGSFESFDVLFTGRGLSLDRTVELLIDAAERALYAGPDTT